MAPSHSRQLLIWTVPTTIAVILSYFWYRRKRPDSKRTDPGEATPEFLATAEKTPSKSGANTPGTNHRTPTFSRSLSGVDSAPIDIVIPPELKASKSNPIVVSDKDIDLQIEKFKLMKSGHSIDMRKSNYCTEFIKEISEDPTKIAATPPPIMAQNVEEEKNTAEILQVEEIIEVPNNERDSANHSPADVIMISPSLSCLSDNHSEGSNDSGKGGSDMVTPPPSRPIVATLSNNPTIVFYEFVIPQQFVGKLIGKHGSSVTNIKDKTGAHVVVRRHPGNNKLKVCTIEGTQKEIDSALKLIRDKFPLKRFPEVTLEQVTFVPQALSIVPDQLQLKLIECINNDTIVCNVVAPNHLFLQQPTHPSFPNLHQVSKSLNESYSKTIAPLLPTPIIVTSICVACVDKLWYRAMIESYDADTSMCCIKLLDYGGFMFIESSNLRQIRADFMSLPFQALECVLANIRPIEETGWSEEALAATIELTKGALTFTQVVDYTENGIPLVNCFLMGQVDTVFLNRELVNQGHAEWVEYEAEAGAMVPV